MVGSDGFNAWQMFVPGDVYEAAIPDLSSIEGLLDIPTGFLTWGVFAINIPGFVFDEFRYQYLSQTFWSRWSADFFAAQR